MNGVSAVEEDKIDMYFIHLAFHHMEYGRLLLIWLMHEKGLKYLNVNEQNDKACKFYQKLVLRLLAEVKPTLKDCHTRLYT